MKDIFHIPLCVNTWSWSSLHGNRLLTGCLGRCHAGGQDNVNPDRDQSPVQMAGAALTAGRTPDGDCPGLDCLSGVCTSYTVYYEAAESSEAAQRLGSITWSDQQGQKGSARFQSLLDPLVCTHALLLSISSAGNNKTIAASGSVWGREGGGGGERGVKLYLLSWAANNIKLKKV